jgi:hypothetical protein
LHTPPPPPFFKSPSSSTFALSSFPSRVVTPESCTAGKPAYLAELRKDAAEKGATVVSPVGNSDGGWGHTMVFPSIVYPVTSAMKVWNEEQVSKP